MNIVLAKKIMGTFYNLFPKPDYPFDGHTHSTISDGTMRWSDIAGHYWLKKKCYITDHTTWNEFDKQLEKVLTIPKELRGIELHLTYTFRWTHKLEVMCSRLRKANIYPILFHSSSRGQTNWVVRHCDIDVLVHPGFITPTQAKICAKRGIKLEITANPLWRHANPWIRLLAKIYKVELWYGSDSHDMGGLL